MNEYIKLDKEKIENGIFDEHIFVLKEEFMEDYLDIEWYYALLRNDKDKNNSDFNNYPYEIHVKSKNTWLFRYYWEELTEYWFNKYKL